MLRSPFMRRSALILALIAAIPATSGCGSSGDTNFDPAQFVAEEDPQAQQALLSQIVNAIVTGPGECWDASVIVANTGIVSQWQFSSDGFNLFYRFVGFDTHQGTVLLRSVGRLNGLPSAVVETWTGGLEGFVLVNEGELVHLSTSPGGGIQSVAYGMGRGTCL